MAATPIAVFIKAPTSVRDYAIRWRKWLKGDTIASSSWSAPAGITVSVTTFGPDLAIAWISGGTDGANYLVTNTIVTAGGRTEPRTIQFSARDR